MDLGLRGKRAVVTGGSLGIGRAVAQELAREGAEVAIIARDAERLKLVASEIAEAGGGRVIPLAGDLGRHDEVIRIAERASERLGRIDILVNNAGSTPEGGIEQFEPAAWEKSIRLKLLGYVGLAQALLPPMREARWGRIVNVIGRSGHQPRASYLAGGAVNAALLNFTVALAEAVAADGVLVNGVNPGPIDTPRWRQLVEQASQLKGITEEAANAAAVKSVGLGRLGTPEEVAALVLFLCSERASFVSGALYNVDGAGTRCI
jgi:NAD(P)-dependent dehydrogenase (short-subunit alcohol dehydrogenase family)